MSKGNGKPKRKGDATVLRGDCLEVMRGMESGSVDAVVCDPPAGVSFMNCAWDGDKGGRDKWVAWLTEVMRECLRLLKPGGHALVWALPRTSHWTGWAIEEAGFEVRDRVTHMFGSGFPKSLSVDRAIDREAGAERKVVGIRSNGAGNKPNGHSFDDDGYEWSKDVKITAPATPAAAQWAGYGTALKPAAEDWWLARKPLECGTVAANVLRHGTGGINVDGCRINVSGFRTEPVGARQNGNAVLGAGLHGKGDYRIPTSAGRWPANVTLEHSAGCVCVGKKRVKASPPGAPQQLKTSKGCKGGAFGSVEACKPNGHPIAEGLVKPGYASPDGTEEIEEWVCEEGCAVAELDRQSGVSQGTNRMRHNHTGRQGYHGNIRDFNTSGFTDSGGASRFYYTAKAARRERWIYCRDCQAAYPAAEREAHAHGHVDASDKQTWQHLNAHPTVKPVALMRWLCRLVTPPGGTILDPFLGSGTTAVAAVEEGFKCVGIEREPEYAAVAEARIASYTADARPLLV